MTHCYELRVKTLSLFPIATLLLMTSLNSFAQTKVAAKIHKPYLEVFVVEPPHPINWKTPKTLLKTTLLNGLSMDYAPNGHLIVSIQTDRPNRYGVKSLLTGMTRTDKTKTMIDTIKNGYGLSAMTHPFPGDLDSKENTAEEMVKAKKEKRLTSIRIQLTDETADQAFDFMNNWIEGGSFRHYGGMNDVAKGEGSGCADFATHFVQIALSGYGPTTEWDRSVYMPYEFLTHAPGRAPKKVSMLKMMTSNTPWAKSSADGEFFTIPDPEKITAWIKAKSHGKNRIDIIPENYLSMELNRAPLKFSKFDSPYRRESEATVSAKWKSIRF